MLSAICWLLISVARRVFRADDSGYGFDNNADVLSASPLLLDRYISAAQQISRQPSGIPQSGWSEWQKALRDGAYRPLSD